MSQLDTLSGLLADGAIKRMRQISEVGVTGATVQRAVAAGLVERVSRGAYRCPGAKSGDEGHLAAAIVRIPQGLICLRSAAFACGLSKDRCDCTWVALPHTVSTPRVEWPPLRYVRFRNPLAFVVGVDTRILAGVAVRITTPARTVVDMLRLSQTVGEDLALACLRTYHRRGLPTSELHFVADELGWGKRIAPVLKIAAAMTGKP